MIPRPDGIRRPGFVVYGWVNMTDLSNESLHFRAESERAESLRISEIFYSLQGEARESGLPTVFVRLTGCPLRCSYCDSEYAFYGGERMTLAEILQRVQGHPARHVCVTGGEPLAQPNCLPLLKALCDAGYEVSLETSGAMPVEQVDPRVSRVVDLKTPASGEQHRNRMENLAVLTGRDQIKFVICDRTDYDWAKFTLDQYRLPERVGEVLFSPSYGQLQPRQLAEWILDDGLPVRLQLQLHKLLWGDIPGV
ncbi:7-carboxy-7-deazaguanine synthase [Microbulbifer rhizosphaerae]|uniref:7-carboxy-7-deazaguanine synthase n=2 Tax=Microbulbifer rhizosphaerae TaxID=1562603 RepID=A0A7W4WFK3_9GAMM|nr:7-carboxy-7-deazaguanine synthase [Microbulbifer rhizosphaerae]